MSSNSRLVLDANILMRAVFGVRVLQLLETYELSAEFYTAEVCIAEARRHIPIVAVRRRVSAAIALSVLERILRIVHTVDLTLYNAHEKAAQERISYRDPDDWPIVATALLLDCPVWTEDQDFFGSGVATWTTRNVEIYLRNG